MKKSPLILMAIGLIAGSIFLSGCNTSAEKNVDAAQDDLDKANEAYLADMDAYRREAAAKVEANNKSLAAFKARIETEKAEAKAEYKKRIAELERKNTDIKKRLDNYKADGKDNWEVFKREFGRDMDELGKAFKDLTVNNVK